jgi:hypothetical protein
LTDAITVCSASLLNQQVMILTITVTCKVCKYEFCWVCLGEYNDGPCTSYTCRR